MEKLFEYETTVPESWVDHNGHMNDAEYNRAFSDAGMAWLSELGLGESKIEELSYTIFTLESHIVYQKEVFAQDEITVEIRLHDFDAKRLHVFMTLRNPKGDACATYEVMYMGMDQKAGRPAPFPEFFADAVKKYYDAQDNDAEIKELGRKIGIRR
ncbi:thioesterase family protein [Salinicoccus halodurans]|uniref:Acyl-CoA thioester hydrolase n=1 Tax=Salinicoccus halodurans TaxID=407035 RepID=A0A0F7D4P6_9STAP|nr:thioesterase [Salinicoccus halodurans]SFK89358.1 acyl-CoA thioester hydrolase [Salinicoccus halodurans]